MAKYRWPTFQLHNRIGGQLQNAGGESPMKIVQPAAQSARTKDADGSGHHTIKMCPLSMWMWLLWSLGVGTSVQYSNDIPSAV